MIEKLKNAGLGFYVRETETRQKLGTNAMCMQCIANIIYDTICRENSSPPVGVPCA